MKTQQEEFDDLLKTSGLNNYSNWNQRDKLLKSTVKEIDSLHSSLYIQKLIKEIKVVGDICYVIADPLISQLEGRRYTCYMPPRNKFLTGIVLFYENGYLAHPLLTFHCHKGKKTGLLETTTYDYTNDVFNKQIIEHYVNGKLVKSNLNEYMSDMSDKKNVVSKISYLNHPTYCLSRLN